jgi:hypothetical protein
MDFLIILGMTIALFVAILIFHALLLFIAFIAISLTEGKVILPPLLFLRAFFFLSVVETIVFALVCACVQICVV